MFLMPSSVSTTQVVVDGVSKTYPRGASDAKALDHVSLSIGPGEMVAIVGPSGCGKTTLLNLIGCLDSPTTGTIRIGGDDVAAMNERGRARVRRDCIGSVFQFFNLLSGLTIAANVGVPLLLQHVPEIEARRRVDEVLERVGIREQRHKLPDELSGGQQQRAAIARAIVHRPAILIADEPTGNLDSRNADSTIELFRSLASEGQAIILATHANEAANASDRVVVMRDGRIVS